jgi:hypothetical protein
MFLVGADFTSLAVMAGGLSVGIGFGLKNIVDNFTSGLILLFGRSIQAGDTLEIGPVWCKVVKVNIRNTVVRTFDNATIFVPNSDLVTGKIVNWTHRDPMVRKEVTWAWPTVRTRARSVSCFCGRPPNTRRFFRPRPPGAVHRLRGRALTFKLCSGQ